MTTLMWVGLGMILGVVLLLGLFWLACVTGQVGPRW